MEKTLLEKCLAGDISDVKNFLERGFSSNLATDNGQTIMTAVCQVLLETLAIKPLYNSTHFCKAHGVPHIMHEMHGSAKLKRIMILLLKYCDGILMNDANGKNPLHLCALTGDVTLVKACFDNGVNLNCFDAMHNTIIHTTLMQCSKDPYELVKYCINERKMNPNICNRYGKTALHYAAWYRHCNSIKSLILGRASVNVQDNDGNTPLMQLLSTIEGQRSSLMYSNVNSTFHQTVDLLLKAKTKTDFRNRKGKTVFHYSAETLDVDLWNKIMPYGGEVGIGIFDIKGQTPLHSCIVKCLYKFSRMTATWSSMGNMVWALINSGAELHTSQGNTDSSPINILMNMHGESLGKAKVLEAFFAAGLNIRKVKKETRRRITYFFLYMLQDEDMIQRLYNVYGLSFKARHTTGFVPRSLENICGEVVRKQLHPNAVKGVTSLIIPKQLKEVIVPSKLL